MLTSHGVATPAGIIYPHVSANQSYATYTYTGHTYPGSLADLMRESIRAGFSHCWIAPGQPGHSQQDLGELTGKDWDIANISYAKNGPHRGQVSSITGRLMRPSRSRNTRLIFQEATSWPIAPLVPTALLSLIDRMESRLLVPMSGSPTSVGLRFLERMHTQYYDEYFRKDDTVDWESLRKLGLPFFAWFPPVAAPLGFFLHCFDRNSSHTAAAVDESMGIGCPYHQIGGTFNKRQPGLWCVTVRGAINHIDPRLPALFPSNVAWLPTPLIRVCQLIGGTIDVQEAFLWPEGKPVFERWGRSLWQYRQESTGYERECIKKVMNNTIGSMRLGDDMAATMRPDWYRTIVGAERAMVWYKAWRIGQAYDVWPCAAYADALYYLSREQEPGRAVPEILRYQQSLGGYKHAWTLKVTPEVAAIMAQKRGAAL